MLSWGIESQRGSSILMQTPNSQKLHPLLEEISTTPASPWKVYLWFIANYDVILHGIWYVVNEKLQISPFRHSDEACSGPGRNPVLDVLPLHYADPLRTRENGFPGNVTVKEI